MFEEAGLKTTVDKLIGVYSDPNRDPRGHTITVAYKLNIISGELKSGDDASDAKFFDANQLPLLSFDHDKIIKNALEM